MPSPELRRIEMADEENNEPKKKGFILRILIFVVAGLI